MVWWRIALVTVLAGMLTVSPLGTRDSNAAITVTRALPATVSPGQTFDVTVNFTAPANGFNAIGLTDFAPAGWTVTANGAWCSPAADFSKVTGNRAEYVWLGLYDRGTAFAAAYRVTVPPAVTDGTYSFTSGTLEYYIGGRGRPVVDSLAGASKVQVVPSTAAARALPSVVSPGATFDVTVTFSAPATGFSHVRLTDLAPDGWPVSVNRTWCNPPANSSNAAGNRADYAWNGPFVSGTAFTAVYRVTVPAIPTVSLYSFTGGTLGYRIGSAGPSVDSIGGQSQVAFPPMVMSVTPANGATNVDINTRPTVIFGRPMNGWTVNASTFIVAPRLSAGIEFAWTDTIEYGGATNMTLNLERGKTPPPLATVSIRILGTVTDAQGNTLDGNGNGIAEGSPADDYTWSFTTGSLPPTVTATNPSSRDYNVPVSTSIAVTFSGPMNTASAERAFSIAPSVRGAFSWADNATMTFRPTANLAYNGFYQVTIGTGARSLWDKAMAAPYTFSFTTASLMPSPPPPPTPTPTAAPPRGPAAPAIPKPGVTTGPANNLLTNSASLSGDLTSLGFVATVNVSFVWGTAPGNHPNSTTPQAMSTPGVFTANLAGLSPGTTYYFRAKADGGVAGTGWGDEIAFVTTSPCFIATAAYGTDTAQQIEVLREFRNRVLLRSKAGSVFVSLYYRVSPPIADIISRHELLRAIVRKGFVEPIVAVARCTADRWRD